MASSETKKTENQTPLLEQVSARVDQIRENLNQLPAGYFPALTKFGEEAVDVFSQGRSLILRIGVTDGKLIDDSFGFSLKGQYPMQPETNLASLTEIEMMSLRGGYFVGVVISGDLKLSPLSQNPVVYMSVGDCCVGYGERRFYPAGILQFEYVLPPGDRQKPWLRFGKAEYPSPVSQLKLPAQGMVRNAKVEAYWQDFLFEALDLFREAVTPPDEAEIHPTFPEE